ncbi:hypothetical protein FE904_00095 [Chryseobacterium indologenes]|uniref:hypothetical protein n=1 Tax=Chryseobacterium indologenes TaxID=253 RepID=UPI001109226A|nr:hypothetical protein [Chryseobacterium indologenes]TLX27430.1 hypothetical protein FE904_00095 [Chryseobacterium indologenes]
MDNTEKDGMEILNQVIESCKANIESNAETKASVEDYMNVSSELEQSVSTLINIIDETSGTYQKENEALKKTVSQIPKTITAELSQQSIEALRKSNLVWVIFGTIFLAFLMIILIGNFALKWYSESIRSKSELRQEILFEFEKDGKLLYPKDDIQKLEHNTKVLQKWINKNPKDAEKFLRFKDGYEAR